MFTGLVEDTGEVLSLLRSSRGARLKVSVPFSDLEVGESVSVNGACQTVAAFDGKVFECDVLLETLRVTNLGSLRPGSIVNLERALRAGGRLGGHIVNGHVDGTGTIRRIVSEPRGLEVEVVPELGRYMVAKGSVAIDGISLTVGPDPTSTAFRVFIIPHTWESTNLRTARPGAAVNIEVDIIAKYIEKLTGR